MILSARLAGHSGGLEERGSPGPLGHDGGGGQANGDLATRVKGRVEIVSIMVDIFTNLKHPTFRSLRSGSQVQECRKKITLEKL